MAHVDSNFNLTVAELSSICTDGAVKQEGSMAATFDRSHHFI
jgi:hypothetical protein